MQLNTGYETTTTETHVSKNAAVININDLQVLWYDLEKTISTMDFAARLLKEGCSPWTLITAGQQLQGRGTHGRDWISLQGKGLLLSLILPPPSDPSCMKDLSVKTAGSLVESLNEFYDLPFEVKHPNDVVIHGRKVAGILFESVTSGEDVVSVILGMGINLNQSAEDFMQAGLPDATSLFIEAGYTPLKKHLLISFLKQFKSLYETLII